MSVKIIYAQSRQPGIERTMFQGLWRQHGGIAMQQPDFFGRVSRYVQADVIQTASTESGEERVYDGVGEIHYPDLADLETAFASEGFKRFVAPDGARIFGSPNPIRLIAKEDPAWFDREACAKVYTWVSRPPDLTRASFAQAWAHACADWATDPAIRASVRSYVRSVSVDPESEFDAVEEVTFDSFKEARRGLTEVLSRLVRSLAPAIAVTMLARQVVLLETAHAS